MPVIDRRTTLCGLTGLIGAAVAPRTATAAEPSASRLASDLANAVRPGAETRLSLLGLTMDRPKGS